MNTKTNDLYSLNGNFNDSYIISLILILLYPTFKFAHLLIFSIIHPYNINI